MEVGSDDSDLWSGRFLLPSETNLSAHEHVDEGVVGCAGLGEEGWNDGHRRRHHALPAKGHHHRHHGVRRPAQQEAGDHQEKHNGDLLLIPQDLDDLNGLEVLDGADLQKKQRRVRRSPGLVM